MRRPVGGTLGQRAYHRHDDEPACHGRRAAHGRQAHVARQKGRQEGNQRSADYAGKRARTGHALPQQSVKERRQERACDGSPRQRHQRDNRRILHQEIDDQGQCHKQHAQHAHDQGGAALLKLKQRSHQIQRNDRRGGKHQRSQRGNAGRKQKHHKQPLQSVGNANHLRVRKHGGHDLIRGHLAAVDQIRQGAHAVGSRDALQYHRAEAAREVRAARHHQRKEGRDDRGAFDAAGILDGEEFVNHLRHAQNAHGGQQHVAQQPGALARGRQKAVEPMAVHRHLAQLRQTFAQAAGRANDVEHHRANAHEHDDALDEIRNGRGLVAAGKQVHGAQQRNAHHAPGVIKTKGHLEHGAQALVHAGRVRQKEQEDDAAGDQFEQLAVVTLFEKAGNGGYLQLFSHDARGLGQQRPGQKAAHQRVSDAAPHRGQSRRPAGGARVAHNDHGAKITGPVAQRAQPRTHIAPAQQEFVER